MLYGGFSEARPATGDWRVKLPEDDPEALALLLNIIHGRFEAVPLVLPNSKIYKITVLSNKYDLTQVLRPWARRWTERFVEHSAHSAQVAWIAWELGDRVFLEDMLDDLLLTGSLNEDGNLVLAFNDEPLSSFEMLAIMNVVGQSKSMTVNVLLQSFLGVGEPIRGCHTFRTGYSEAKVCDAVILSSLVKGLAKAELFPLPQPEDYPGPLLEFYDRITGLRESITILDNMEFDHTSCNPLNELLDKIDWAWRHDRPVIDEKHKSHLEVQAKKSGVASAEEDDSLRFDANQVIDRRPSRDAHTSLSAVDTYNGSPM
ncbi:hypothetical protein GE09DRAFT_1228182 [Coniochaeta sp. 2T2.1]|nr:hypothetical protein GE09DRAFT_1228182 [Coniochaeta sp. 2T2.1]